MSQPLSVAQEWKAMWPLPFVAMIGIAGQTSFAFANGVFLGRMTEAFGWSRAEFASGFTIHMLVYLAISPLVGRLVDRVGPRKVALLGIVPFVLAYSLLGVANGSIWQWRALCALLAVGIACVASVVWVSAVVGRFNAARGTALAVALCGMGVASAVAPIAAAFFIQTIGWRLAFAALACSWAVVILPLAYVYFHGPRDRGAGPSARPAAMDAPAAKPGEVKRFLRSGTFICLVIAGGLYAVVSMGTSVHLVSMLTLDGFTLSTAAAIAGVVGLGNIVGQLGAGVLVDRYPARWTGIAAFLLPVATVFLLYSAKGSLWGSLAAVLLFGLSMGGQTTVVSYMASRMLPSHAFSSIYAVLIATFAVSASLGPLLAGRLFDVYGSYDAYLLLVVPLVLVAACALHLVFSRKGGGPGFA
ncbi:MFS transporter [Luteimonas sp. BDR2-5]|uniref:MFS transporter n=1 Tax=Proluteimonas luteida TaxID=2878685 RepID=UPI001E619090|nr:MFS transporter [Luteimonas sp. BDR2-5]MCD9029154.1 MFS transporter [Luteimonas sp. BDR2-5]